MATDGEVPKNGTFMKMHTLIFFLIYWIKLKVISNFMFMFQSRKIKLCDFKKNFEMGAS